MIFHAQHDNHDKKGKGERESKKKAYAYFMTDKGKAPERLNEFLIDFMAEGNDVRKWQLYTDNEIVLNSKDMNEVVADYKMPKIVNSCEYEPWQNGKAERFWRDCLHAARHFTLRGFGDRDRDDGLDPDAYWPYCWVQATHV